MSRIRGALADTAVVAKRNVIKIKRVPDILVFVLLSPIMFVVLFGYVFGNSIDVPGGNYREFLIAGIFAQTVLFGAIFTGTGIAEDMQKGIINRFRSLPMRRSAVLAGRTLSDVVYNVLSIAIMSITGLLVGWRIRTSVLDAILGFLLLLLFAYAVSWVMASSRKMGSTYSLIWLEWWSPSGICKATTSVMSEPSSVTVTCTSPQPVSTASPVWVTGSTTASAPDVRVRASVISSSVACRSSAASTGSAEARGPPRNESSRARAPTVPAAAMVPRTGKRDGSRGGVVMSVPEALSVDVVFRDPQRSQAGEDPFGE